jgi:hypothetical protein
LGTEQEPQVLVPRSPQLLTQAPPESLPEHGPQLPLLQRRVPRVPQLLVQLWVWVPQQVWVLAEHGPQLPLLQVWRPACPQLFVHERVAPLLHLTAAKLTSALSLASSPSSGGGAQACTRPTTKSAARYSAGARKGVASVLGVIAWASLTPGPRQQE